MNDRHEIWAEITLEMIAAGVKEFSLYENGDDFERTVVDIYLSMERARIGRLKPVLKAAIPLERLP